MRGRPLFAAAAIGPATVLGEPLSLWGGLDPTTGRVIEPHHPRFGADLRGRVVVMPSARGSSSSSSVLAEAIRTEVAPSAFLLGEPDLILAVGAAVAAELYGRRVPIVVLPATDAARIREGDVVQVAEDGAVVVR
jgi:predicted aconitase with swiveling domain